MMRIPMIAAAFALAGATAAAGIAARPANWMMAITPTKAGTYVYGNPAAKAKIVEYLSYTCSHCAHFTAEAWGAIEANYIARGTTSIEVRHAVRDPIDMAAAVLARCEGPTKFLGHSKAIFAAQEQIFAKAQQFEEANGARMKTLDANRRVAEYANGTGLTALVRARGMPQAKINACLADKRAIDGLAAQAKEAWTVAKISGTPAFMINGTVLPGVASWGGLKPALDAAAK